MEKRDYNGEQSRNQRVGRSLLQAKRNPLPLFLRGEKPAEGFRADRRKASWEECERIVGGR